MRPGKLYLGLITCKKPLRFNCPDSGKNVTAVYQHQIDGYRDAWDVKSVRVYIQQKGRSRRIRGAGGGECRKRSGKVQLAFVTEQIAASDLATATLWSTSTVYKDE